MPANHGLRTDDVQSLPPSAPPARQPDPEQAIEPTEPRPRGVPESGELLPQREVLEREVRVGPEGGAEGAQKCDQEGHQAQVRPVISPRPA